MSTRESAHRCLCQGSPSPSEHQRYTDHDSSVARSDFWYTWRCLSIGHRITLSRPDGGDPRSNSLDDGPCTHRTHIIWTRTLGISRTQGRTQNWLGQALLVTDCLNYWDHSLYILKYILGRVYCGSFDWFLFTI